MVAINCLQNLLLSVWLLLYTHILHILNHRTFSETIGLDHYNEHSVQPDHPSLQWLKLVVFETLPLLDLHKLIYSSLFSTPCCTCIYVFADDSRRICWLMWSPLSHSRCWSWWTLVMLATFMTTLTCISWEAALNLQHPSSSLVALPVSSQTSGLHHCYVCVFVKFDICKNWQ